MSREPDPPERHFEALITAPARGRRGIAFKIDGRPVDAATFTAALTGWIDRLRQYAADQPARARRRSDLF